MENWDALAKELEACRNAERPLQFWWRDDGAATVTPQLERMLEIAAAAAVTLGLAVVPRTATSVLAARLRDAPVAVWQHGWAHRNHGSGEFGESRRIDDMIADVRRGQRRMDELFGPAGWQRVFVPPYHQLTMELKSLLAKLGFCGVSAGHPRSAAVAGLAESDAEIDLVEGRGATFIGPCVALGRIVAALRRRRLSAAATAPIGILTHHARHGEEVWSFLQRLLPLLRAQGAEIVDPAAFFPPVAACVNAAPPARADDVAPGARADDVAPGAVSVVLTSGAQQDALERAIDSFFRFNTHPIARFSVVADAALCANQALRDKYAAQDISWISRDAEGGWLPALDAAYGAIATPYVFQGSDAWEFCRPAFIEKSLVLLDSDPHIARVWIGALDAAARRSLSALRFFAGETAFHGFEPDRDGAGSGGAPGFACDPGLRRMRDYRALGAFAALDPDAALPACEVARRVTAFYRERGYYAVALADAEGHGYVRPVGHVPAADPERDLRLPFGEVAMAGLKTHEFVVGSRVFKICNDAEDTLLAGSLDQDKTWKPAQLALYASIIRPDSVCLDIGGNIGTNALAMACAATEGKVYTFEPAARICEILRHNIARSGLVNIEPVPIGLADRERAAAMAVDPTRLGNARQLRDDETIPGFVPETIRLTRLDSWLRANSVETPHVVKIDVVGFEREVIDGGPAIFADPDLIAIVEFAVYAQRAAGGVIFPGPQKEIALLAKLQSIFAHVFMIGRDFKLHPVASYAHLRALMLAGYPAENLLCCHQVPENLRDRIAPSLAWDGLPGDRIFGQDRRLYLVRNRHTDGWAAESVHAPFTGAVVLAASARAGILEIEIAALFSQHSARAAHQVLIAANDAIQFADPTDAPACVRISLHGGLNVVFMECDYALPASDYLGNQADPRRIGFRFKLRDLEAPF